MTAPRGAHGATRIDWIEPLKAFALLAVLLNHLVESFGPGPWFTNPGAVWPSFATRLGTFFPSDHNPLVAAFRFAGWLGDSGPGVFIFCSGLGLTLGALSRAGAGASDSAFDAGAFYRRRLLRIYPLYIAMHFVILGLALGVPGTTMTFGSPKTLLSLTGVRALPAVFFYIAPAWWFVWLILQLYAIYPILWGWLTRLGPARFVGLTVAITLASRAVGLAMPAHRYYWLTGLFFGSRLAEFTVGMACAVWVTRQTGPAPSAARVAGISALVYVAGLAASFFLWGALVSNLLVTLGLCGLFYALWRLFAGNASAARIITWLGVTSYAVYLLHQPPLIWAKDILGARPTLHGVAALMILALSFPAAVAIERAVAWIEGPGTAYLAAHGGLVSWVLGACVVVALLAVEPQLEPGGRLQRALCFALAVAVAVTAWLEWTGGREGALPRRVALVSGALALFAFPAGYGYLALIVGALIALCVTGIGAWVGGIVAAGALLVGAELALHWLAPTEVGGWGERPALIVHPTRGYGLIPSHTTHLRYNDYDYVVHTNTLGLPGPEVAAVRATPSTYRVLAVGDAFTMPEGLNYGASYPAILDSAFRQCGAQVIDGGVTGYGPNEEEPEMRELVPMLTPNVVVYQFYVNEWSDIRDDSAGRRIGIGLEPAPGVSMLQALRGKSQVVTHLHEDYDAAVAGLRGRPSPRQTWKLLLQYYGRGPNILYAPDNIARMTTFLDSIRDVTTRANSHLLIAFVPGAVQVSRASDLAYLPKNHVPLSDSAHYDLDRPLAELRPLAEQAGIPILDLTDSLRRHEPQPVYYRDAWHWNAEGHRAAAAAIAVALKERGWLPTGCAAP